MPSELSLNEQYAVTCKGWTKLAQPRSIKPFGYVHWENTVTHILRHTLPDFIHSDAELGRMVKTLRPEINSFGSIRIIRRDNGDVLFLVETRAINGIEVEGRGTTENEASARACIALKLQVPYGDET